MSLPEKEKFNDQLGITPEEVIQKRRNDERRERRKLAEQYGAIR